MATTHTDFNEPNKVASKKAPYGYCPICGLEGATRERRMNGDDTCVASHKYPSRDAVPVDPTDTGWIRITSKKPGAHDVFVLNRKNHCLITHGTFGIPNSKIAITIARDQFEAMMRGYEPE